MIIVTGVISQCTITLIAKKIKSVFCCSDNTNSEELILCLLNTELYTLVSCNMDFNTLK